MVVLRLVLTCLAAALFALGWSAGKLVLALAWLGSAVLVGWDAARTPMIRRRVTKARMRPPRAA